MFYVQSSIELLHAINHSLILFRQNALENVLSVTIGRELA